MEQVIIRSSQQKKGSKVNRKDTKFKLICVSIFLVAAQGVTSGLATRLDLVTHMIIQVVLLITFLIGFMLVVCLEEASIDEGRKEGYGNPIRDPKSVLQDHDVVTVLRKHVGRDAMIHCLIDRNGTIFYFVFEHSSHLFKERHFYRVRYGAEGFRLEDLHDELASAS